MGRPGSRKKKLDKFDFWQRYQRWWLGKMCRIGHYGEFRKVTEVELVGPPSFVYGDVWLHFDDGDSQAVYHGDAFKPRKKDVEVLKDG